MGARLRIVSINDVYSLENLPRLRSLVRHYAKTDPADAMLVTLPGDFLSPSLLSSLDAGRGMVECLNAIGVTHVTFGNHEDDLTTDDLRARMIELHAKWLGTNVPGFGPPVRASDVIEFAGVRVGLVGVVLTDDAVYRRVPFGGGPLEPPNEAALREASRLVRDERCATVIPLTHQSMQADRELARAGQEPPFPVILGGHEHDVHLEQIGRTWIAKAASEAAHAVVVDLRWDDAARPPVVTVRIEDVAGYPEDRELRALVDGLMKRVHEIEGAVLLRLPPEHVLSSVGARSRQTSLGSLLCSRIRDCFDAGACLFNGGGIRASREYRDRLTYGDIEAEVPFENEIVVVRMPGRVVREAVAASRAQAPEEFGGFLQVDDEIDVGADHRVTAIGGAPLDDAREYAVAIVRDLLFGLDRVEPLVRFAKEHPEKVPPPNSGRVVKVVLVDAFSIELWRQLGGFDAVDSDHDGIVTEADVARAIARTSPEPTSPLAARLIVHALDTNHDLVISRDEADATKPTS